MQGVVLVSVLSAVLHYNHTAAELMHDAACRCTVPVYLRFMSEVVNRIETAFPAERTHMPIELPNRYCPGCDVPCLHNLWMQSLF